MVETALTEEICGQIANSVRAGASVGRACEAAGVNHETIRGGLCRARRGCDPTGLYGLLDRKIRQARAARKLDRLQPMIRDLKRQAGMAA